MIWFARCATNWTIDGLPMKTVVRGLRQAMQNPVHKFWPDDINPATATAISWSYTVVTLGHND